MKIRIFGLANDSIVDGPGLRLAVFTQGCPHRCEGCHNPESHDFSGGEIREIEEILEIARDNFLLDGITLSGGDPFLQPEACSELAKGAHDAGLNVWCYTGYTYDELISGKESWRELLKNIDVLVDGRFVLSERSLDIRFRGSRNQRIINIPESLSQGKVILSEYN